MRKARTFRRAATTCSGFNGAAAWQLRKAGAGAGRAERSDASMGPQLGSCGRSPIGEMHSPLASMLQWGRSLTVAEGAGQGPHHCGRHGASMGPQLGSCGRFGRRSRTPRYELLQWGRSLAAAEGARPHRAARWSRCFNGAAAWQLRKARGSLNTPGPPNELQWGRSLAAAEGAH